jgi:AcrR family transcriptional regulator
MSTLMVLPVEDDQNVQMRTALRMIPKQKRSRETFETILIAASDLLGEVGWDGFNTNLLAERAGVKIPTVYRYFPDKLAIASAVAETVVARWNRELGDFAEVLERKGDLPGVWLEFLRRFYRLIERDPATLAVRKAMQVVPELKVIDQADNEALAEALGAALHAHLPTLPQLQLRAAARVLIETAVAAIDAALTERNTNSHDLLAELEAMHLAYLDRLCRNQG